MRTARAGAASHERAVCSRRRRSRDSQTGEQSATANGHVSTTRQRDVYRCAVCARRRRQSGVEGAAGSFEKSGECTSSFCAQGRALHHHKCSRVPASPPPGVRARRASAASLSRRARSEARACVSWCAQCSALAELVASLNWRQRCNGECKGHGTVRVDCVHIGTVEAIAQLPSPCGGHKGGCQVVAAGVHSHTEASTISTAPGAKASSRIKCQTQLLTLYVSSLLQRCPPAHLLPSSQARAPARAREIVRAHVARDVVHAFTVSPV